MHESSIGQIATLTEWQAFIQQHPKLVYVDAFVFDVNGQAVGKRIPVEDVPSLYEFGIQYSLAAYIADVRGHGHNALGMGYDDGDPDGSVQPLPQMLTSVPWARVPTAQIVGEMRDLQTGESHFCDPRWVLNRVLEQWRQLELRPVVACELEFYLIDPKRSATGQVVAAPPPGVQRARASNLSLDTVSQAEAFLAAIQHAASVQGLPVSSVVAEYGVGQYEVNLLHVANPLMAADHAVLLKRLIRGVARQFGLAATFMAKPFLDQPGNGLHLHISVLDKHGRNLFGEQADDNALKQAIAGLQALTPECFGLLAPNFNSYRRFLGDFVPVGRDWGSNNRSVAFRIPLAKPAGVRIEHRIAGADASPHLVLAATLAGMHHGLVNKLQPTQALAREASIAEDPLIPRDLMTALTLLEQAQVLPRYVDARFLRAFAHNRRGEYWDLHQQISAAEVDFYA
jgi:glutamine synthetase